MAMKGYFIYPSSLELDSLPNASHLFLVGMSYASTVNVFQASPTEQKFISWWSRVAAKLDKWLNPR